MRKLCLFVDLLATGGKEYNTNKQTRLHLPLELNARKNTRLYNKLHQSCCTHLTRGTDGKSQAMWEKTTERSCPRQDFHKKLQNITQLLHNLQDFNHKVSQNTTLSLFTCPSTSAFCHVWLRLAEAAEELPPMSSLRRDRRHIKTHPALNQRVTAGHNMAALCHNVL